MGALSAVLACALVSSLVHISWVSQKRLDIPPKLVPKWHPEGPKSHTERPQVAAEVPVASKSIPGDSEKGRRAPTAPPQGVGYSKREAAVHILG